MDGQKPKQFLQPVLSESVNAEGSSLPATGTRAVFDEKTAEVPGRDRTLRAVRSRNRSVDPLAVTGVWETSGSGAAVSEEARAVRTLGRMLLSAGGADELVSLKDRLCVILERYFERSLDFFRPEQWAIVIQSVEWIAGESGQYKDIVLLLHGLSELPVPLHLKVTLKLRASFYLEHRLGDLENAMEAALEAHALSPLSAQTTGVVCEKIREIGSRLSREKSERYWQRLVQCYLDVLAESAVDKDKQVGVLVMLGWLFCDGMDDLEQGCRCLERARRLDPDNRTVAAKLAVLEAKCAERTEVRRALGQECRPPAQCPPISAKKKYPFIA